MNSATKSCERKIYSNIKYLNKPVFVWLIAAMSDYITISHCKYRLYRLLLIGRRNVIFKILVIRKVQGWVSLLPSAYFVSTHQYNILRSVEMKIFDDGKKIH